MTRTVDPAAWPPPLKIDRKVVGWCTGLAVLLLVGFPLMVCLMFAEWDFSGYVIMDEGNAEPDPVGGLFWLAAAGLLLAVPVAAGLIAGRRFARAGWRVLAVAAMLGVIWCGIGFFA